MLHKNIKAILLILYYEVYIVNDFVSIRRCPDYQYASP